METLSRGCREHCREHAAPWEVKMTVVLPLPVPELCLQAAVGLWYSLTNGRKVVQVRTVFMSRWGFGSGPACSGPLLHPPPQVGLRLSGLFSCVKAIGFQAIDPFSVALLAFLPAYVVAIALPACPAFASAFTAWCFHLCVGLGWCHG